MTWPPGRYSSGVGRALRRLLFAALLAIPFFWRLDAEEFHGDESHWITSGQQAFFLVTSGRLGDAQWQDEFYFYSQPQVGKLLIGAALAAAGRYGPAAIYDYDWQRRPQENRAAGRVPPDDAVLAGRVPSAVAGWLACLLLQALARTLGLPGAGPTAALLLASHPLWLANARRAGLDAPALCLGLLATWAAVKAIRCSIRSDPAGQAERGRGRGSAAWWLLAGAAAGLATGTKYVGLLMLPLAAAAAVPHAARRRWLRRNLAAAAAAGALGAALFLATNPALYDRPWERLAISIDFLTAQAAQMRRQSPIFDSPALVALEIVDRAIWPTGFPPVTDRTLPEPLVPGSYGTPMVALGAATALVALAGARPGHRFPFAVAGCGAGAVFAVLTWSLPTWWERWHLPLIPPLCLLAAFGLARIADLALAGQVPPSTDPDPARPHARPPRRRPGEGGHRRAAAFLAGAQFVAAMAMEPTFLGRGFGALIGTPVGAGTHLAALAVTLVALVSQAVRQARRLTRGPRGGARPTVMCVPVHANDVDGASAAPAGGAPPEMPALQRTQGEAHGS